MPPAALAMVLAAALCHASWNLAAKKAGGGSHFVLASSLLVAVLWAPLAAWSAFGGGGAGDRAIAVWGAVEWACILASGAVHLAYFSALLHGYRVSDLTVVYPVARGSGPLLSAAGAMLLLGESPGTAGIAGALAVVGGVFLVAGGSRLWRPTGDEAQRQRLRDGVAWGAATGGCIAVYTLIDGYAVKMLLMAPLLVDYLGNLVRAAALLPQMLLRDRAGFALAWRSQWPAALVTATLGPLSYLLVLHAMRLAPLGRVAPAREVSLLFAALLGGRLLGEGDRWARLAGAAGIAAGVAALALG